MSEAKSVQRFDGVVRVFHWAYAVAFIALAVTGFVLLIPWTSMATGEAGETNRFLHRIFGVVMIVAPLLPLLFAYRSFTKDMRLGFSWKRDDRVALKVLLSKTYWTGDTQGLPEQGRFMAGQKINIATQVLSWAALVVTGLVMWFLKGAIAPGLMAVMILVHSLAAIGAVCVTIVHLYMVTTLPYTREAIGAMFSGRMPEDVARSHHPKWHAEVTGQERK